MDPLLWKIRLNTGDCDNYNLLMAMIYVRYCPALMDFRFEGNHYLMSKDTVNAARKINGKFSGNKKSLHGVESFALQKKNNKVEETFNKNLQNQAHNVDEPHKLLKNAFESAEVKKLFATCFDEQFYEEALRYYNWSKTFPCVIAPVF